MSFSYVFTVEHVLSVLEYLSDSVCCLYGKPGPYGVLTLPFSVREGINIFLAGFVHTENLRFQDESLTFKVAETERESVEKIKAYAQYRCPTMTKTRNNFQLGAGSFKHDNVDDFEVEVTEFNVSYKPQKISPKYESTVKNLLYVKIPDSCMRCQFISDVMKRLLIEQWMDREVLNPSGGELMRVALCLCLGKPADIYLIDEPSAYLDSEQGILAAKVIIHKESHFPCKETCGCGSA
ncbi:ATP-binding cassette sub-family E member 1 [Hibiscus syriacus]|uniref:ATP-binding cassette sub-family E member 1 n=1 Tax=Hibiscus syriacus TaxID=106335 RepID=A0A6A3CYR1_HIBSY|nr:ATP-binding cassette sub-family E member 1 [Hibiscus syriacus]